MKKCLAILLLLLIGNVISWSQSDRFQSMKNELEALVVDQPGLDELVETSVSQVSITEFLRTLGISHSLNLNVSNDLDQKLINNFSNARVADVLIFLCKEYDLELEVIGGIISMRRFIAPIEEEVYVRKMPKVTYDDQTGFLSLDLKKDSLDVVAREITSATYRNVVLAPGIEGQLVSAFIQNRPFEDALEKMCFANNLTVRQDGNFFLIEEKDKPEQTAAKGIDGRGQRPAEPIPQEGELSITKTGQTVSLVCKEANIAWIIEEISRELGVHYFVYSRPEGNLSLFIENAGFEDILRYIFHGTDFSFIKEGDVYLIGTKANGLVTTEMVQLKNRTIENAFGGSGGGNRGGLSSAGSNNNNQSSGRNRASGNYTANAGMFGEGLDIQPFPELNSFIVSGSFPDVKRFKDYIFQIDQVVPVVMIEVLIVDVNKNRTMSAGINAGLGENPGTTSGTIIGPAGAPGVNMELSTESINDLIGTFNGFGVVNLGNVSPDFYLNIQAMESDGLLRTRSTPKLATLNSYTASLKIGQQEYYLETRTNVNSSAANNVVTEQQVWMPLEADLSIEITPVVSGAEQVTLDILVTQSNFTERAGSNGPFGTVNREFESSIRVKNGEMILLGGLEDKTINNSGGGLPLLARIPVLRWFFGNRTRSKDETKLNIFIRPTIIY